MASSSELRQRRKLRQRYKINKISPDKVRLIIHRTCQHTYAQIVDPSGKTMTTASTMMKEAQSLKNGTNKDAATFVGKVVAERALKLGVKEVVFDRSGYLYHGRVKALAEAARQAGLVF
ncbi:MAG: 50S ribosomal protein L18 [Holosporales bacterium]